jgi:hypothetical protein
MNLPSSKNRNTWGANATSEKEGLVGVDGPGQGAKFHNPSGKELFIGCCNKKTCGRFVAALLFCFFCAVIGSLAMLIHPILGYIVAAGIPFITVCVYASEIFGGTSIDRGQTFLVIVLHWLLFNTVLLLFIYFIRNPVAKVIQENVDHGKPLCHVKTALLGILGGNTSINVNQTKSWYYTQEELESPCWGLGLALGWAGALPEEIMKFFTLAVFMRRGWIADQFSVLVYSFVIGCTFGFIENLSYVLKALSAGSWAATVTRTFLLQTVLHPAWAVISGMLLAQRKFLFWRSHGPISCCECDGPRPTILMVLPAIYFHFINNFAAAAKPSSGIIIYILDILRYSHAFIAVLFAVYLFLTLNNVPRINIIDLGKSGILPKACSYICCCGCLRKDSTRDRRYESVLNMTETTPDNEDGKAYLPPTIVEA